MTKKFVNLVLAAWCCFVPTQLSCVAAEDWQEAVSGRAAASYRQGVNLEHSKKWREALNVYLRIVALEPTLAPAWMELGRCYLELHDYEHAEQCYRYACEHLVLRSETLFRSCLQQLIRAEEKNGELEAVQQTRRFYVARFPNAPDAYVVSDEIKYYERDFASTRKFEAAGRPSGYWHRSWLPNGLPKMPIKVSISASKLMSPSNWYTKSIAVKYRELAERAFLTWSKVSDGKVTFDFVASSAEAQIVCEWTNNPKELDTFAAGHCETINRNSIRWQKQRPLIWLGPHANLIDAEFYNTCLHEIGHALGLDHSSNPQDVMYSSEGTKDCSHEFANLSKQDITRLRTLYTYPTEAAKLALEFGSAAFVERDYEAAYELLSETEKKYKSLDEFQHVLSQDKQPTPASLEITEFFSDYHRDHKNFCLLGRNQKNEKSYYIIETVVMPDGNYRIAAGYANPY